MFRFALATAVIVIFSGIAHAQDSATLQRSFNDTVQPFLTTHCTSCHGEQKPKANVNLSGYRDALSVAKDWRRWEVVLEQIETGRMPPANAKSQPTADSRRAIAQWIAAVRKHEAKRTAGDPGRVPARRLSNAEFDNTIRDLTGVDIRPAKEFPVDPANEAGFDNSADSLAMSPGLVTKYLEAARRVSDHLLILPDRLAFAEYTVVAETDRDKFCVRQIIDFYKRQRTDYADYFLAAWKYRQAKAGVSPFVPRKYSGPLNRELKGETGDTLAEIAKDASLSPKYLETIWSVISGPRRTVGPIAALQTMFAELPADEPTARAGVLAMRDLVVGLRKQLTPEVKNLLSRPMNIGSQPLVMWKNREMAANRRSYAGGATSIQLAPFALSPAAMACLVPPDDAEKAKQFEAEFAPFCSLFPDAFFISERARIYLDPASEQKLGGRYLSAGFHNMMGYFRDDAPLYDLVLTADQQKELDRLWLEFDVVADIPARTHKGFIWFERAEAGYFREKEFDIARAEDFDAATETKIKQLAEIYMAKVKRTGSSDVVQKAVKDHFDFTLANIRRVETARAAAEPKHLADLQTFAERAFRRPLANVEKENLVAFYRERRKQDGLSHEDAVRDTLVSILVSPHFLFRLDTSATGVAAKNAVEPLSDVALASRLSYFLWSSMPDAQLLAHAKAGHLKNRDVLLNQVRRMTKDARIRALATEFCGNWLDFRRFEEHNAVDRERFPTFNDDLRRAMFEEPVRYFLDVVQSDRSVLDLIHGNDTFVNSPLAKHYGMSVPRDDAWVKVPDAKSFGRGGLLPMAVFLTKNAPGLRTSPVKRGYWLVSRVLGERIPAPPAEVPELPSDEAKLGDKSLREMLAHHRADKACAGCHARFDSFGLSFEGYGPVGERRTKDLGGRPIDARAEFPGGAEGDGFDGLRRYIKAHRDNDFVDNLCRKMLAFALGRTLLPGDDGLIDAMKQNLAANGHRFSAMIEPIVLSTQFLNVKSDGGEDRATGGLPARTPQTTPLKQAHAHNDYEHKRPLLDALDQGFCSVEADVFLTKDGLLVAHTSFGLKPEKTLQKLYLDPLRERAQANGGRIHKDEPTFYLLIDIKTDAKTTYPALAKVLADYADIFTVTKDGKTTKKAVTAIISGNCDRAAIAADKERYCAIDGRPKDLEGDDPADLVPWVSESWKTLFKWKGDGPMPDAEKTLLREHVRKAHAQNRLVRFWGTPDGPAAWGEQLDAGVDLINTDRLAELRDFLSKRR
jgi:glycerophosphoryl diester phosphodiesterase